MKDLKDLEMSQTLEEIRVISYGRIFAATEQIFVYIWKTKIICWEKKPTQNGQYSSKFSETEHRI